MNPTGNSSGADMELAQIIAASPEWGRVKDELVALAESGANTDEIMARMRDALSREGLGGEAVLECVPAEYIYRLSADERAAVVEYLNLMMLASVLSDVQSGSPLALPGLGRGVTTQEYTDGEVTYPVVRAVVTPLDNPAQVIAEFVEACHRAFNDSAFASPPNATRDAEWWRRYESGERLRAIALDDPRSGLAPEVLASPKEDPDEVARATDVVRRAVRRFKARWTQKADLLSKKPG